MSNQTERRITDIEPLVDCDGQGVAVLVTWNKGRRTIYPLAHLPTSVRAAIVRRRRAARSS